jgi:hypothetical protein
MPPKISSSPVKVKGPSDDITINPPAKAEIQPKDMSDYQWLKKSGWNGNMRNFMISYCLKIEDDDDVEEAKRIIAAFHQADQEAWEDEQAEKNAGKS